MGETLLGLVVQLQAAKNVACDFALAISRKNCAALLCLISEPSSVTVCSCMVSWFPKISSEKEEGERYLFTKPLHDLLLISSQANLTLVGFKRDITGQSMP